MSYHREYSNGRDDRFGGVDSFANGRFRAQHQQQSYRRGRSPDPPRYGQKRSDPRGEDEEFHGAKRYQSTVRQGPSGRSFYYHTLPEGVDHQRILIQKLQPPETRRYEELDMISNFFKLDVDSTLMVYQYSFRVGFDGEAASHNHRDNGHHHGTNGVDGQAMPELKKWQERVLRENYASIVDSFFAANFPHVRYFHDVAGINVYTLNKKLSLDKPYKTDIETGGKFKRRFHVRLNPKYKMLPMEEIDDYYEGRIDEISKEVMNTLHIALGFYLRKGYNFFGRNYFDRNHVLKKLQMVPLNIVAGFRPSIAMTEFGLALNLHPSTVAMIPKECQSLGEFYELCQQARVRSDTMKALLKGRRVITIHNGRQYRIDGIVDRPPTQIFFKDQNGNEWTVAKYFRHLDIRINEHLPAVIISKAKGHEVHLPFDVCRLATISEHFISQNKLPPAAVNDVLRSNTHKPLEYFNLVARFVEQIVQIDGIQDVAVINSHPTKLVGEVLGRPKINPQFSENRFYLNADCNTKWAVVSLVRQWNMQRFVADLLNQAQEHGLELRKPDMETKLNETANPKDLEELFEALKKRKITFAIFALNREDDKMTSRRYDDSASCETYQWIKYMSEMHFGILTQCMAAKKTTKPGYIKNILRKINEKMGGRNNVILSDYLKSLEQIFNPLHTMVVGLDVNHSTGAPGSDGDRTRTSVAAAVGTLDSRFSLYTSVVKVQKPEDYEFLGQLDNMIDELLDQFKERTRIYPKSLVIFRDGVAENQFSGGRWSVLEDEIPLIKKALQRKNLDTKVRITVIVVQKQHTTRLALLKTPSTVNARTDFNATNGVVVCQMVVDPNLKSFIMYSHKSPLGTSKPKIYTVLHDELGLSDDFYRLTEFCLTLCNTCLRTPASISIPTPIKYADLAAYRAKMHLMPQIPELKRDQRPVNQMIKVHQTLRNLKFYG